MMYTWQQDIRNMQSHVKRQSGESIESVAARLYYAQMEVYSAYAGRDLDTQFELLPDEVRAQWIAGAKKHCGE
jgi:hypothetical protein